MSYGPFPDGHTVAASEWNEFVQALDDETTRATAAEVALGADISALDGRIDDLETFQSGAEALIPIGPSTTVLRIFGAESLASDPAVAFDVPGLSVPLIGRWTSFGGPPMTPEFSLSPVLPPGCRLRQIYYYVDGYNWGSLPSTQLVCKVFSVNLSTGTETEIDSWTDAPADVAAINTRRATGHVLSTPQLLDGSHAYLVRMYSPLGGTDSGGSRAMEVYPFSVGVSGPA
jgi:hypothetical protein